MSCEATMVIEINIKIPNLNSSNHSVLESSRICCIAKFEQLMKNFLKAGKARKLMHFVFVVILS